MTSPSSGTGIQEDQSLIPKAKCAVPRPSRKPLIVEWNRRKSSGVSPIELSQTHPPAYPPDVRFPDLHRHRRSCKLQKRGPQLRNQRDELRASYAVAESVVQRGVRLAHALVGPALTFPLSVPFLVPSPFPFPARSVSVGLQETHRWAVRGCERIQLPQLPCCFFCLHKETKARNVRSRETLHSSASSHAR